MPPDANGDAPKVYHISKDPQVLQDLENLGSTTSLMIRRAIDKLQFDPRPSECVVVHGTPRVTSKVKETQDRYRLCYQVDDNQSTVVVTSIQPTDMLDIQGAVSVTRKHSWEAGWFCLVAFVIIVGAIAIISAYIPWYAVPTVIIGGLSAVVVIGAFRLSEIGQITPAQLLSLIAEALKQMPLIKGKRPTKNAPEEESGESSQEN